MTVSGGINVSIQETRATRDAIKRLSIMKVTPEMRREMMKATAPAVPALRGAIRELPSMNESPVTPGLRAQLSKKVGRRSLITGNTITVMVFIKGGGLANLARVVEGTIPWEHPVFGRMPPVGQESHPFFIETMVKIQALVHARMRQAQIKIKRKL